MNSTLSQQPAAQAWIDLADLAGLVASDTAGTDGADAIVDAMLGGPSVLRRLSVADLRASQWMASSTPQYLAGGPAIRILLQRRGLRAVASREGGNYVAQVCRPGGTEVCEAVSTEESRAVLLAVIQFVTRFENDA